MILTKSMIRINLTWFLSILIQGIEFEAKILNITTPTNLESRIINGQEVEWKSTRYQVSIRLEGIDRYYFGSGHICGGSIIGRNIVLTASHCIWNENIRKFRSPSEFSVVMGNINLTLNNNNTLKLGVSKIITGEHFNYSTFRDDLAILFLNQSISESYNAAELITINENVNITEGTTCYVTGWGLTEKSTNSRTLMSAKVPIISRSMCSVNYGADIILDGMLCAGYMDGKRDACSGDSGGPLICDNQLVGLVSFGLGCALVGFPGVYTNVAYYYDWLYNQTGLTKKRNDLIVYSIMDNNINNTSTIKNCTTSLGYSSFLEIFLLLVPIIKYKLKA